MSSCKVLPANRQAPSREEFYDQHYKLPNGYVGAWYKQGNKQGLPLIVCIHGGGTNSTFMDRPGWSYPETAAKFGCSIVLLDRPSYAGNKAIDSDTPIVASIPHLVEMISTLWNEYSSQMAFSGVFIIGHSIGGATTLQLAAEPSHPFPLLGVAVSGLAELHADDYAHEWTETPNSQSVDVTEALARAGFGPLGTYEEDAYHACKQTMEPAGRAELIEISQLWGKRCQQVMGAIRVPVWHGLAEYEKLWKTGTDILLSLQPYYRQVPLLRLVFLTDGGHNYEFHKKGEQFRTRQMEFGLACARLFAVKGAADAHPPESTHAGPSSSVLSRI